MKKLYVILGGSLLLTGCFDEVQPEKAVVKETAAEKTAQTVAAPLPIEAEKMVDKVEVKKEEVKKGEQMVSTPENVTFEPAMEKETKLVDAPPSPQDKLTDAEQWNQAEAAATAINAKRAFAQNTNANSRRKSVRKTSTAKAVRSTAYDENGLSPEEQRVGAQQVMSAAELKALKYKCRYPLMSPQERVEYHCEVKPVTLK
ncbi:hypothetical protein A1D29_04635 [Pasteurellaceae bacterium Orientalotternb1]|nr:hypothetical protein A1D29_04635 [Pasteurellaceae bacterium Orientalotternb1]